MDEAKAVQCSKCGVKFLQESIQLHESTCKRSYPVVGKCTHCNKKYKQKKALNDHEVKCKKRSKGNTSKSKKKKKSTHPHLRRQVWLTYIGENKTMGKCFCCWDNNISPWPNGGKYESGHIIAAANGGLNEIGNLLPICRSCNNNMSDENWDVYVGRHPHLRIRVYGNNLPKEAEDRIRATIIIQSFVRMWLEKKNPDSVWRLKARITILELKKRRAKFAKKLVFREIGLVFPEKRREQLILQQQLKNHT